VYTYAHISGWIYKGYDNPIPWDITPKEIQNEIIKEYKTETEIVPTLLYETKWRYLPSSGYVDNEIYPNSGTFDWIDGTGPVGTTIRFTNPISRYQAEYQNSTYDSISQLSSDHKDEFTSVANVDNNVLYFNNSDIIRRDINIEPAESDSLAYRTDPINVRPGQSVNVSIIANSKRPTERWNNAKTVDKTIHFLQHSIGFTDECGSL